ncbi:3'-phosphatase, 5'-polynucleotide kinase [Yersinia phage vB_YenM_531]|nr:3'-phosphatase, 5'-polynucleotide kinase [Yersinia phage vB_YenM_531]QKN87123.1 3'-phosphatase, 5'-polynucleotide kinase [Yersinia phage vB_YenM_534]QKN87488.1 3'-phosphatase, 5'-polynucleotide kinase [Yersinia phage vB_YenM_281]
MQAMSPKSTKFVIVDIDGTLSCFKHRLNLVPPKEEQGKQEAWRQFVAASVDDPAFHQTINTVNDLKVAGCSIIILTARSEEFREITEKWLKDNCVAYDKLIMRSLDDLRSDEDIKEEVLRKAGLERIRCVFEDSPRVVKRLREMGLQVYQCQ